MTLFDAVKAKLVQGSLGEYADTPLRYFCVNSADGDVKIKYLIDKDYSDGVVCAVADRIVDYAKSSSPPVWFHSDLCPEGAVKVCPDTLTVSPFEGVLS